MNYYLKTPPTSPSRHELETLYSDCKVLKNILKKHNKQKTKKSVFSSFALSPSPARVEWLVSLFGEEIGSDKFDNYAYAHSYNNDHGIVGTLEEAAERWENAHSIIYDLKVVKKTARLEENRKLEQESSLFSSSDSAMLGVAKVFCDDSSHPDLWETTLHFCGFEVMKNLRMVNKSFNSKIDLNLVKDYLMIVTNKVEGLQEINDQISASIRVAPVLLPYGKGLVVESWKVGELFWKFLNKGWGVSTKMMLEEAR